MKKILDFVWNFREIPKFKRIIMAIIILPIIYILFLVALYNLIKHTV